MKNKEKGQKPRTWYSLILIITLIFFTLTASIAVPVLNRPFYYAHIEALNMPESSGYSYEEIVEAFDDVMDSMLLDKEFKTGVMKWTESEKAHFEDCAGLFKLDLIVLVISIIVLIILLVLKIKGFCGRRFFNRGPSFWAGSVLGIVFLALGGLVASDFDQAFVTFHHIFFPGKENWIFNPATDEIINVMPETYFMNCGILIVVILLGLCAAYIVFDLITGKKYSLKKKM